MELKRTSHASRWLIAGGSMSLLAVVVVWTWFLVLLPYGTLRTFFDLESYRDTLNAVHDGALMFDWLGYPPVTLILISPLRGLPVLAGDQLWTGGSFLMLLGLAAALTKLAMNTRPDSADKDLPTFLAGFGLAGTMLFLNVPATNQLQVGNVQLIVITLAFLDAAGVLPRKWQGTLVGLAAAIKITPLIFFPYYLFTRQWRQAAMAAGTFTAATAVGFVLFPRDSLYFWTHTDSSGRLGVDRMDNVSILGTLTRWMADPGQARMVWYGLALVVGLAAFWRAWQHFRRGEQMEAALVIGAASTAISPIAWPNYQLWLPMAAVWLIATGRRRSRLIGVLIFVPYFALYAYPLYGLIDPAGHPLELAARMLWELNVVVPMLICVLGLPRRVVEVVRSEAGADTESPPSRVPTVVAG